MILQEPPISKIGYQEACGTNANNLVKILDNEMDWEYRAGDLTIFDP